MAFLGLVSSCALAHADDQVADIEGVYDLDFHCSKANPCSGSANALKKLVVFNTSPPVLLGSGRGMVMTLMTEVSAAFAFVGVNYDSVTGVARAYSPGGMLQAASITFNGTQGVLRELNSPDNLYFTATPVRTVGNSFPKGADVSLKTEDIEGVYQIESGSAHGTLIIKALLDGKNGPTYGGKFVSVPEGLENKYGSGFVSVERGLLSMVDDHDRYPKKFLAAFRNGAWSGFTVHAFTGVVAEVKMKKIRSVEPATQLPKS